MCALIIIFSHEGSTGQGGADFFARPPLIYTEKSNKTDEVITSIPDYLTFGVSLEFAFLCNHEGKM